MPEEWRPVKGYKKRYSISNRGRVRSLTAGRIMRLDTHWKGYKVVYFYDKENPSKKFFVHRLVADAFISNPHKKRIVNHKDENKRNNHFLNLEWMSDGENTRYYYECRRKENAPVSPFSEEMKEIEDHALKHLA